MKKKGVAKAVQAVFASLLSETRGKRFDPTKRQTEYRGWDSFVHMQLAAKIEDDAVGTEAVTAVLDFDK